MLRFLLRVKLLFWIGGIAIFLLLFGIGKTASRASEIAFFSQNFDTTEYWRLDLNTGIASKADYTGRILRPDNGQSSDFFLVESEANFSTIYQINPQTQEQRFVWTYDTRHYQMLLAGDYVILIDYRNHWSRVHIPSGEFSDFGQFPNLSNFQLAPNGQWLAGSLNENWYFINLLDGSSYIQRNYRRIAWSPNSQWYLAISSDNPSMVSVFNIENGSPHQSLSSSIQAPNATWGEDGQTIFFQDAQQLASISLLDGHITEYPSPIVYFVPECLSPNQSYGLVLRENHYRLERLDTGEILWQLERESAVSASCIWSADSRYLISYYTVYNSGISRPKDEWERFFVIDTETGNTWDLYPESLPSLPLYLHIPN